MRRGERLSVRKESRGGGGELGSDVDQDQENDADPSDPDPNPQH